MKAGRGLPALSLVAALTLVPAAYATRHGMLEGALQLVSAATGSPATDPPAATAARKTAAPASRTPSTPASSKAPAAAAAKGHRVSGKATPSTGGTPGGAVRAAGVVPIPGPPAPPPYPWQVWSWAGATATSNEPCLPRFGPGHLPIFTLTTTNNTPVATWTHNGDPAVQTYWFGWHDDGGDKTQREAPIRWLKVTPPTGCTKVTATFPTLTSGHYHLWMEMDVSTPELPGTKVTRVGLSQTNVDIA